MARRSGIILRDYRDADEAQVIVIAQQLQRHETAFYDRLIAPERIGAGYVARLMADVAEHRGRFVVAEVEDRVAGYATLLMLDSADERDEIFYTFAHVGDLAVLEEMRSLGIGGALLAECERLARAAGQSWLRLGVHAANASALRFYERAGLAVGFLTMEKKLT